VTRFTQASPDIGLPPRHLRGAGRGERSRLVWSGQPGIADPWLGRP